MRTGTLCLLGLIFLTVANSGQAQLRYRTNNNAITIIGCIGTNGDVTIPSTINGYPVVSIGDNAFQNAFVLTNVTISSGVTYVGSLSFYNCTNLQQVSLPDTLTAIGMGAFRSCTDLTGMDIP